MRLMDANMATLVCIFLVIAIILSADLGWTAYRDWRAKRLAIKHGRTLTAKFCLPLL